MQDTTHVYSGDKLLVTDNEVFTIQPYNPDDKMFFRGTAYLNGPYYYLYRGDIDLSKTDMSNIVIPGLYTDEVTKKPFLVEPILKSDKDEYTYANKVSSYDPSRLVEAINTKEQIIVPMSDAPNIFMPEITKDDDILKRLTKMAIIKKSVDLDSYKHRFLDKNSLFNFKSVIKSNNTKLSILLFDRGVEALNLKYTIILEEKDPDVIVGSPLKEPIIVTSEDTYDV